MLNDTSQVPGSQSSSSHRPISHPLHVPQDSISVEPSLLKTNERPHGSTPPDMAWANGRPQGSTPPDMAWANGRPQGSTSPDMAWANGRPQGSTPPPTPPSPLLYNEKDVREAHHSVYSRGGGGRVEWGGPLWSPVEPQQATDPKNLPLWSPVEPQQATDPKNLSLRSPVEPHQAMDPKNLPLWSPVEAPIVPEPILHTKTNPSNFVGIDSPRPQADVSRSPVGADSSRSYQRPFSSNEQPLEPVRVTIGRVEVRATLAAQEPSQRTQATRPAQPAISLQTYLEQRRSGKV